MCTSAALEPFPYAGAAHPCLNGALTGLLWKYLVCTRIYCTVALRPDGGAGAEDCCVEAAEEKL
jgi:hypothetical protein